MIITFARDLQELTGINALRMKLATGRGLVFALMVGWVTDHQPLSGKIPLSPSSGQSSYRKSPVAPSH